MATFSDPMDITHTLDPALKAPRGSTLPVIRLLKKESYLAFSTEPNDPFELSGPAKDRASSIAMSRSSITYLYSKGPYIMSDRNREGARGQTMPKLDHYVLSEERSKEGRGE